MGCVFVFGSAAAVSRGRFRNFILVLKFEILKGPLDTYDLDFYTDLLATENFALNVFGVQGSV